MSEINKASDTQIKLNYELIHKIKVYCALKKIHSRVEFCDHCLKNFFINPDYQLIAPIKGGKAFRVSVSNFFLDKLKKEIFNRNTNFSRIMHTAIQNTMNGFSLEVSITNTHENINDGSKKNIINYDLHI